MFKFLHFWWFKCELPPPVWSPHAPDRWGRGSKHKQRNFLRHFKLSSFLCISLSLECYLYFRVSHGEGRQKKRALGRGNTPKKIPMTSIEWALSDSSADHNLLYQSYLPLPLDIVKSQVIQQNTTRVFISFCPESPDFESQIGQLISQNKVPLSVALGHGKWKWISYQSA